MNNYRYTHIIEPLDRYFAALTPAAKKAVHVLEGGLVMVLLTSLVWYVQ
ncbi:MAG: hypothetical protein AB8B95_05240 [Pseudohongiellaceae bacterium]